MTDIILRKSVDEDRIHPSLGVGPDLELGRLPFLSVQQECWQVQLLYAQKLAISHLNCATIHEKKLRLRTSLSECSSSGKIKHGTKKHQSTKNTIYSITLYIRFWKLTLRQGPLSLSPSNSISSTSPCSSSVRSTCRRSWALDWTGSRGRWRGRPGGWGWSRSPTGCCPRRGG